MRQQLSEKDQALQDLRSQIEELSRHDPLTGALNRRSLIEILETELQRALRTGHPFCFAIMELDRFKETKDLYGHPAGDVVLKTVADTAVKLLRTVDRFGRLDGSEFGIVLPATWLDQGLIAMDRLSKAVAGCNWESVAAGLTVSFSAGITTNAPKDTSELMVRRAEKALAQAKQEGRNRTVQIEEALPDFPPMD
ncbi:MAG TPA: GGDEF domain-containing protein [Sulfuriferula sp.]|nr:GGDEF domain-containing protein [Sulfuriferula sp.]